MVDQDSVQAPVSLAAMLHDMRNRMFQLQAQLHGLIQGRGNDTELCDALSGIESGFGSLSGELNVLLQRLQVSSGPVTIRAEQHPVASFLHDAIAAMPEPSIAVSVQASPDDLHGWFDQGLMALVIRDALDNACRFAKSRVLIRAEQLNGELLIRIDDDGDGFGSDAGELAQTGLGLSIARRVIEAHRKGDQKGRLELGCSEQLGGASLQIYLP